MIRDSFWLAARFSDHYVFDYAGMRIFRIVNNFIPFTKWARDQEMIDLGAIPARPGICRIFTCRRPCSTAIIKIMWLETFTDRVGLQQHVLLLEDIHSNRRVVINRVGFLLQTNIPASFISC